MNEMDGLLLKWHMKKNGDAIVDLAKHLNVAVSTLYEKLKNKKQQFTQNEINLITQRYKLTPDDVVKIFFN